MEFFGGEALIFTKFFRCKPIFFTDMTQFFRGECNFSQSSGERRKVKSSTGGGGVGTDIKCDSPLLLTSPSYFIRIQFKTFKLLCIISSFYKAFVQFSSYAARLN